MFRSVLPDGGRRFWLSGRSDPSLVPPWRRSDTTMPFGSFVRWLVRTSSLDPRGPRTIEKDLEVFQTFKSFHSSSVPCGVEGGGDDSNENDRLRTRQWSGWMVSLILYKAQYCPARLVKEPKQPFCDRKFSKLRDAIGSCVSLVDSLGVCSRTAWCGSKRPCLIDETPRNNHHVVLAVAGSGPLWSVGDCCFREQ